MIKELNNIKEKKSIESKIADKLVPERQKVPMEKRTRVKMLIVILITSIINVFAILGILKSMNLLLLFFNFFRRFF